MSLNRKSEQSQTHSTEVKRPVFYLIALMLPFILFLFLEGLLRLIGFGHEYPLFIKSSYSEEYLQPNPDVVKRFFHQAEFAPPVGPDTFLFKKEKDADSIRIILMGGSSAAGFPYGRFGSPAGMLNQRIKMQFPDKKIDIISIAMASINSYALLDFVDEVIAIEPDAVLIYAGHNEYLGVMGVGSVYASNGSHAANLLFLKLKEWRIFQLIQSIYYSVFEKSVGADHSDGSRTVMASVAKEKAIVFESELFEQGKQQFEQNLDAIQGLFKTASIPVYLSTIASNEKDLEPFSSSNSAQAENLLAKDKKRSNTRIIQQGIKLLDSGERSADLAYRVARAMLAQNDKRALSYFILARDYDLLRFRAPSAFNDIIKHLAQTEPAVILVDSLEMIRKDTSGNIIGSQHMLEHLHPTPRGYFVIADTFYQALLDNNVFASPLTKQQRKKASISIKQAWVNMPLSEVDQLVGEYKISLLSADYPFTDTRQTVSAPRNNTAIEKMAKRRIEGESWITTQQELLVILQQQNNTSEAAKAAGLLYDALPMETELARVASLLYLQINQLGLAEYYARQALADIRADSKNINLQANFYLTLAEIIFKSGNTAGALEVLEQLLQRQPDNQRALTIKQQISPKP